jgi:hypothetical protein
MVVLAADDVGATRADSLTFRAASVVYTNRLAIAAAV